VRSFGCRRARRRVKKEKAITKLKNKCQQEQEKHNNTTTSQHKQTTMWKATTLLFLVSLGSAAAFSPGLAFQSTTTLDGTTKAPSDVSFGLSNRRSILYSTEGSIDAEAVEDDSEMPGGMTPEKFKKMTDDPEVMAMLQSDKIQEAMQLMMTGEQGKLEQALKDDPELQQTLAKLDGVMKSL
jgi:hypothetical protein